MKKLVKKVLKAFVTINSSYFLIRRLRGSIRYLVSVNKGMVFFYNDSERSNIIDLIHKIKEEREMILEDIEAYQLFIGVKRTEKVEGDIAEIGVYKGGSAKLICEAKGNRTFHLFDSFEGIPKVGESDDPQFHQGQFLASLEEVKNYLGDYKNTYFYKGIFPLSTKPIESKRFSFVNLDVDTYGSTLDCLKFFYPRMNVGGIIISHDYMYSVGVRKAIDEFFRDKPEPVIILPGTQCLIVKAQLNWSRPPVPVPSC